MRGSGLRGGMGGRYVGYWGNGVMGEGSIWVVGLWGVWVGGALG